MVQVCRGYVRVSTEEQAEEGYSLAAQVASLREHCQRNGWTLAQMYTDEGISAKNTKRPGLQQLLADLQRGEIVLVWKLDRLSRSVRDTELLYEAMDKGRASLVSVMEPQLSTAGASGVLVRQITAVFAEHYRRALGENVRHGMTQLAKQGRFFGGSAPLGYSLQEGKLVPNEHADLVRRIFGMYLHGLGVRRICATLNAEGLRTPRGHEWSHHPVSHILQNPAYVGRLVYGRIENRQRLRKGGPLVETAGEHEPIIDAETWGRVQTTLATRKRLPARTATGNYPLTGILRCGLCGAAVRGLKRLRGTAENRWHRREYWCRRRTNAGACKMQALMADRLESAWLTALLEHVNSAEFAAIIEDTPDPALATVDTERELAEVNKRLQRWSAAYESGAVDLSEYQAQVTPLREHKRRLAEQQAPAPVDRRTVSEWREIALRIETVWHAATPAERKELVYGTGLTVTVFPGYRVELHR